MVSLRSRIEAWKCGCGIAPILLRFASGAESMADYAMTRDIARWRHSAMA
jgi:hypothetical protein